MISLPDHLLRVLRAGANGTEYVRLAEEAGIWPAYSYWVAEQDHEYAGGQSAGHVKALELRGLIEWVDGVSDQARITKAGRALLISADQARQ